MGAANEIICPVCGSKNAPNAARCVSCGARLEALGGGDYTDEELAARKHQQEGFEWKWAVLAVIVYMFLQGIILGVLPRVISAFDPQGINGLFISVAVWFVGGILVGVISPGKTFLEPAVGALIAVVPTIAYLMWITPEGFEPSFLAYIVLGLLGAMISLLGAFIGEKIQMTMRGAPRRA